MDVRVLLLLLLVGRRAGTRDAEDADADASRDRMAELLSLSELPLERLLHVRHSFEPASEDGDAADSPDSPTALPLVSHRGNPLTSGRKRTSPPLRRGMEEMEEPPWMSGGGGGKSKSKGISKIFQMSITTLAFLAFGGYLLCLIVQAVRSGNGTMPMGTAATMVMMPTGNLQAIRPVSLGRRKRAAAASNTTDEMYRAFTMLAEGYSLYHDTYFE